VKNRLPSGSYLPSGLLEMDDEEQTAFNSTFNNMSLKMGIVKEAYEMDDANNVSRIATEYDVLVLEQRGQTAPTPIMYKNCVIMDMFGGIADFFEWRLRNQTKAEKREKDGDKIGRFQDGAIVFLICLNGFNENAIIVGGAKHPKRKSGLTKEAGHALMGEFNGLGIGVDKDGALTVSFKGATEHDGRPADSKVGGSFIKIKKDGSLEISDGNKDRLAIDKTKESTVLQSGKDMGINAGNQLDVVVGAAMKVSVAKNLLIEAQGSATMKVKDLGVEVQGPTKFKTASLDVQVDGMVRLRGSQIVLDGMTFLGGMGGTPALTINSMWIATGNLGAPIVISGPPISGLSSKVFIKE
jgi:hypothetical protein